MKTIPEIINHLERAAKTERRMQPVTVRNVFCNWPEIIRSFWEAYGQSGAKATVQLTSSQISEYNQAILWLQWLTKEQQQLVWARANGFSWRKIAVLAKCSDKTAQKRAEDAIIELTMYVNGVMRPNDIKPKIKGSRSVIDEYV